MKAKVKTRLNLRKQPNKEADIIRILEVDEVIDYTSEKDGWLKLKGRSAGYCMKEYTNNVKDPEE